MRTLPDDGQSGSDGADGQERTEPTASDSCVM